MEFSFLVDVNLPKRFRFFNSDKFTHVVDIDCHMTDTKNWEYAITHRFVILTKDADFYHKSILSQESPKIVYFQLGNMSINDLFNYFTLNWEQIVAKLGHSLLIVAKRDSIDIVL